MSYCGVYIHPEPHGKDFKLRGLIALGCDHAASDTARMQRRAHFYMHAMLVPLMCACMHIRRGCIEYMHAWIACIHLIQACMQLLHACTYYMHAYNRCMHFSTCMHLLHACIYCMHACRQSRWKQIPAERLCMHLHAKALGVGLIVS